MAAITTADVTYAQIVGLASACPSDPQQKQGFSIAFGGDLTYPSGGVPLQKAKLGCPESLREFIMMDSGATVGYVTKFDYGTTKIRLYQVDQAAGTAASVQPLVELTTAATVSATTLRVLVAGW